MLCQLIIKCTKLSVARSNSISYNFFLFLLSFKKQQILQNKSFAFVVVGADSLCSRLNEKINFNLAPKLVLAHMPLLMVCLEGLGKLAQKFPNIAITSNYNLRDFLMNPSPILVKLHRHYNDKLAKDRQFRATSGYSK